MHPHASLFWKQISLIPFLQIHSRNIFNKKHKNVSLYLYLLWNKNFQDTLYLLWCPPLSTNFHGRSCSVIFRSRVGSLVSKKIPSPRFSPGSCPKAPASPPVLFVNEYQKPPVLLRFSSQMPPVLPRFFWAPPVLPRFPPGSPHSLRQPRKFPRFSSQSTPTAKISTSKLHGAAMSTSATKDRILNSFASVSVSAMKWESNLTIRSGQDLYH